MRVRIGNDFVFLWSIERNGKPENLSECLEIKLTLKSFGREKEIDFEIVNDNIIRIEVTPEMTTVTGLYSLVLKYILADESLSDNDRKCAVDTKAFTIVANTAGADDISEIAVTSDMLIGLKGDPFTYDDFTEEQLADLRQPAIDAGLIAEQQGNIAEQRGLIAEQQGNTAQNQGSTAEQKGIYAKEQGDYAKEKGELVADVVDNESERVQAESERVSAETTRVTNESGRVTAENNRVNAENLRESAESARVELYDEMLQLKTDTTTAKNDANEQAEYAKDMGDYAKEQGEIAETFINNWIKNW